MKRERENEEEKERTRIHMQGEGCRTAAHAATETLMWGGEAAHSHTPTERNTAPAGDGVDSAARTGG